MDLANQQTSQALGQEPEAKPALQIEDDTPDYDDQIAGNLERHLDDLPPELKTYLIENLNPTTINVLGIVNGQEVYDYFFTIYQQYVAPKLGQAAQQNSPQSQGTNAGSQPAQQMAQQPQQQAKATPAAAPFFGG